jgi:Flp pilus assembly protein TadD
MNAAPGGAAADDSASAHASDAQRAVRHARELRANGLRGQAVAVLAQAATEHPKDRGVLAAYGRALADVGNYPQALEVLNRAHSPDQPDWRILSVQGAVLDQMGRPEEARHYYESALRIAPDEPLVLSNLGLSYALSKDLPQAEATLRRAVSRAGADRRVRQNLALVVGLQGRFEEAEQIARADLPPEEAVANVAYLRQMLAQPNSWKKLAAPGGDVAAPRPTVASKAGVKSAKSARSAQAEPPTE